MEASGAGGFEPWEEPKIRALAAAWFHRVSKVNQSAWNFSMLPLNGPKTMDMEGGRRGGGKGQGEEETTEKQETGKGQGPGKGGGAGGSRWGGGYGDT